MLNTLLVLIIRGSNGLLVLALTFVLTKFHGIATTGAFHTCLAFYTAASAFSRFGFDQSLTKIFSLSNEELPNNRKIELWWSYLVRASVISLCTMALAIVARDEITSKLSISGEYDAVFLGMAFALLPHTLAWLQAHTFQGRAQFILHQVFLGFGAYGVFLTTLLVAGASRLSVDDSIGYIYAACWGAAAILAIGMFSRELVTTKFATNRQPFQKERESIKNSVQNKIRLEIRPLYLGSLTGLVFTWASQLIVSSTLGTELSGVYAVANRLAALQALLLVAANAILAPMIAKQATAIHAPAIRSAIRQYSFWTTIVAVPILFFILVFGDRLLHLFSVDHPDAFSTLRVLATGQFINVATGSVVAFLAMSSNAKIILHANIVSAIFLVIASVLATPRFGIVGAAVVQATSLCLQMAIMSVYMNRLVGYHPISESISTAYKYVSKGKKRY